MDTKGMANDFVDINQENKNSNNVIVVVLLYIMVIILITLLVLGLKNEKETTIIDSENRQVRTIK